jgi:hypothetical protein
LLIEALSQATPSIRIMIRTNAPRWLFSNCIETVRGEVDVGVIQSDSLTVDVATSVSRAVGFEEQRPLLAEEEAGRLQSLEPRAIVSDIPPLACAVGARLGVPVLAIGNFGWDWIYHRLTPADPRAGDVARSIAASYSMTTVLLRLPLHDTMQAFPRIEDVPLIAHLASGNRSAARQLLSLAEDRVAALLPFGGLGGDMDLAKLTNTPEVTFLVPREARLQVPPNVVTYDRDAVPYEDILAACDLVVMKPGYGTVADCLANHLPMVYTTRSHFAEEEILVPTMHELGRAAFVSRSDLYEGNLGGAISRAFGSAHAWAAMPADGARAAAARILDIAGLAKPATSPGAERPAVHDAF